MASLERIELIRHLLGEADGYLAKGDPVQSSEKLYKAAEEKGRCTVTLLEKAVGKLVGKLGMDVELGWAEASYLHIWGFQEVKLDVEDVKRRIPIIRRLVELTEKKLG